MSPFKSIKGRALGKLLEGYKSSDIGKGFGSGDGGGGSVSGPYSATGGNVANANVMFLLIMYTIHSYLQALLL